MKRRTWPIPFAALLSIAVYGGLKSAGLDGWSLIPLAASALAIGTLWGMADERRND